MPADQPSRNEQITALFTTHHHRLTAAVTAAVTADPSIIDDAVATAWKRLVQRTDVQLTDPAPAYAWLKTTAIREAIQLATAAKRTTPLQPGAEQTIAGPVDLQRALLDRCRLRALRHLPERQRLLMLLQAAGYTYDEIADLTGHTRRTVDRQLSRANRTADPDADQLAMFDRPDP